MGSLDKLLNSLIIVVVLAIAGSFFYFNGQKKSNDGVVIKNITDHEVDKTVNKYIQQTNQANELNKIRTELALVEAKKKFLAEREAEKLKAEKEQQNLPLEKQIWSADKSKEYVKPAATKKTESAKGDEWDVKKMTPEEKKEYARQYIENARKGGYQIELNEDLEVIKSVPIRKPSQQNDTVDSGQTD